MNELIKGLYHCLLPYDGPKSILRRTELLLLAHIKHLDPDGFMDRYSITPPTQEEYRRQYRSRK